MSAARSTPAAARAVVSAGAPQVRDLIQTRVVRALRQRTRYRYVRPRVLREGPGYRVESPCCSRNVDPVGGTIDIALLLPDGAQRWCLLARDHAQGRWTPKLEHVPLALALDALCADAERVFWP
ncbi:hypothetical protein [Extensimonas sp. H3M7-6]|uniref:DUF3024 domain-containing protein n=1 Tax=Extensimonas soli TaxID=3031322 RepID=UPI0023DBDB01|nr:hypothetical protein [Extensimonas sp. H3M7-6]MDF1483532.1 hypothetical protein [Extensimonas sp. H3M7-6]